MPTPVSLRRRSQRGVTMVEFALAGIASVTLLISTIGLSLAMWNYHTMAYAVHETTRYVAVHGRGCVLPGNHCAITVADIANKLMQTAIGVPAGSMNVTLTSYSGAVTTCNPVTSCLTNTNLWPPLTNHDNQEGNAFTVAARYTFNTPIVIVWPGTRGTAFGGLSFPATSTQEILF